MADVAAVNVWLIRPGPGLYSGVKSVAHTCVTLPTVTTSA